MVRKIDGAGDERGDVPRPSSSHDAELHEWSFMKVDDATVAIGRVFRDSKKRWPDGYAIVTSAVLKGSRRTNGVITTMNTRYRLIGPSGQLKGLKEASANLARRVAIENDAQLFDLLAAAWAMDDETFEKVAGLPSKWMWQWRHHYRSPTDDDLVLVRRLARFHASLRLAYYRQPHYGEWWRRPWRGDSLLGGRSPLEAVLSDGSIILDQMERYFRSSVGW
ncbi:hypothetical protein M8312_00800 [Sphingomonas sp. KRR8]|uniref:hypothetical protein n=1 Tax=Sphingomonas sp. KRR8 TaxID=2942996 RepID=UPI002021276A|nr:hypothetical protein [Sphingomonas sp. KRR8]URD61092.1 hypothetical protein M8312_00800 [Sphingomonas sp. KRR8]